MEAHGSFATHRCIECMLLYPDDLMRNAILEREVPRCQKDGCGGLVKPDIVFFGEALPDDFFLNRSLPAAADLCIIMGTSLAVQPFASLPGFCQEGVPRLLINNERVGGLGSRADDVLFLGDCDSGVRKLSSALGWLDELEATWDRVNPGARASSEQKESSQDNLEDEISKLTDEVHKSLQISKDHAHRLKSELKRGSEGCMATNNTNHGVQTAKQTSSGGGGAVDPHSSTDNSTGTRAGGRLNHVFGHLKVEDPGPTVDAESKDEP